jgi:hypothetical protein
MVAIVEFIFIAAGAIAIYKVGSKKLKVFLRAVIRDEIELRDEKKRVKEEE